MRKRIAIGLLGAVVIGMVAFFLSQPTKGSVEWHKREYLDAWKRLNEQTLTDKVKHFLNRIAGRKVTRQVWPREDHERVQSHRAALLTLGYLDQQAFDFTNCSRAQVLSSPAFAFAHRGSQREFVMVTIQDTNTLHIIALREDMPLFVEAIRKVDKP
jgi:hypothetical protein